MKVSGKAAERSRWYRSLLGALRVAALLSALVLAVFWSALRSAQARVGEALLGFGSELIAWQGTRLHSAPRRLSLNGLDVRLVTASTKADVEAVLDRFHGSCRERGGVAIPDSVRDKLPSGLDGVLRQASEREGVLACLDSGAPLELGELTRRLGRFAESGDLAALGELRYVLARRTAQVTTVLVLWTEGPAPLLEMFPETGDAPGQDPAELPRPANSRRVLSAREYGQPYSLTSYVIASGALQAVLEQYRRSLESSGWSVAKQGQDGRTLLIRKKERAAFVRAAARERSHQTVLTVAELAPNLRVMIHDSDAASGEALP